MNGRDCSVWISSQKENTINESISSPHLADPSCAPNITAHHWNTLVWARHIGCIHAYTPQAKVEYQVRSVGCPPISILIFLGHPGGEDHILSPLGQLWKHLSCHSIHHINSVLPDWRTRGGWGGHKLCLTRHPTLPAWHRAGIFRDEGIGGLRPGWRAARAQPSDWGICWHSSSAPSHMLWLHTSVEHTSAESMAHFTQSTTIDLYQQHMKDNTLHYRLHMSFYTCGGNGWGALHCGLWLFTHVVQSQHLSHLRDHPVWLSLCCGKFVLTLLYALDMHEKIQIEDEATEHASSNITKQIQYEQHNINEVWGNVYWTGQGGKKTHTWTFTRTHQEAPKHQLQHHRGFNVNQGQYLLHLQYTHERLRTCTWDTWQGRCEGIEGKSEGRIGLVSL